MFNVSSKYSFKIRFRRKSWRENSRQILKIKQDRFFYGMFYSWIFEMFYQNFLKIWLLGGQLVTHHQMQVFQLFSWNGLISEDPQSSVVQQLVRQLVHSFSGDNNIGPFHLWWRQTVLKSEKVYKCSVQHCLKIFLSVFTSFKMSWKPKYDQFLLGKRKIFS